MFCLQVNHYQAGISVHGHEIFSAYSVGSCIVYICCVEFLTFRLISCLTFSVRHLNAVFMLRVGNFLRDGPLNRCACLTNVYKL
jgi:hypothetical protein